MSGKESEIRKRARQVINGDRSERFELLSQESGFFCALAGIYAVAKALGSGEVVPRPDEIVRRFEESGEFADKATVPEETFLSFVVTELDRFNVEIKEIFIANDVQTTIPDTLTQRVKRVSGNVDVSFPYMIIFVGELDGVITSHAETHLGDQKSEERIQTFYDRELDISMVITFQKKTGARGGESNCSV